MSSRTDEDGEERRTGELSEMRGEARSGLRPGLVVRCLGGCGRQPIVKLVSGPPTRFCTSGPSRYANTTDAMLLLLLLQQV